MHYVSADDPKPVTVLDVNLSCCFFCQNGMSYMLRQVSSYNTNVNSNVKKIKAQILGSKFETEKLFEQVTVLLLIKKELIKVPNAH
jgi:uncharacterized membrane protein